MKNYFLSVLLLFPLWAQAQLTAVNPDVVKPTRQLTGKPESVYVFFDTTTATLQAANTSATDFSWYWLNPVDTTLTLQQTNLNVTTSSLTVTVPGGYQVLIGTAPAADTLSCWVFFDNFRVNGMTYVNECDALRLDLISKPTILAGYTIYNFDKFLHPPHNTGDSTFRGVQNILWDSGVDIHEGVDDPSDTWKQTRYGYTFIDAPPPLKESNYEVTVYDVFGKQASFTTPYTIPAIAAYAKIVLREWDNDRCGDVINEPYSGEALYRVRFSQEKSLNAQQFYWKGFGNRNQNAGQYIMWDNAATVLVDCVAPEVPYKNVLLDGYIPGKYTVRLTAVNTASVYGCADSSEVNLEVDPSKFDAESIPNAFTPNGDGYNDIFYFVDSRKPVSMEYISVYVFSRSGALVYRYEGGADAWTGWDGRRMGTGGDVADGVYFYVISGEGWDGTEYNTSEYKGALHIFR